MIGSLTKPRPVGLLIVFVLVATVGAAVFVCSSYGSYREQGAVAGWQPAKASIISKEVKNANPFGRGRVDFLAVVSYRYTVDGRQYDGNVFNVAERWATFSANDDAKRFIAELPASGEIEVYVDPTDPARAVMSKKPLQNYVLRMVLGLLGFLIGGSICLAYIRRPDEYD